MTIDLQYPTSWEEVKREHLLILGRLMLKELTKEDLLFALFCRYASIRPLLKPGMDENTPSAEYLFKNKSGVRFWLPVWMIRQACQELAFIIDTTGLPECPILSVNTKLHDVSFKNFYFADAFLSRYQSTKDVSMILSMYKCLTGKKVRRLKPEEINAITIWWIGVKEFLKKSYPEVLQESTDQETDKTPADILQEILSVLNKNNPGQNSEILSSDVHAVMHALNNIYLSAKKHDNK